jgi:AbrB family looped-hinge helix DNA binding protein
MQIFRYGDSAKVTAQGQISLPVDVRRKLGVGPGSVLEWDEKVSKIVVRRAGRVTSEDIRRALFGKQPPPDELKEGIRDHMPKRDARS